jgi:hypothetical protein
MNPCTALAELAITASHDKLPESRQVYEIFKAEVLKKIPQGDLQPA